MAAADELLSRWRPAPGVALARRWARVEGRAGGPCPA
jgi:hypothetical protein